MRLASYNSCRSLRLSVACRLGWSLKFIHINSVCLFFPLSSAWIIGYRSCSLTDMVSFTHEWILPLILLLILQTIISVLIVRIIDYVLTIMTEQLSVLESFLLILLIHLVLTLTILLRTKFFIARDLHILMRWLTTSWFLD